MLIGHCPECHKAGLRYYENDRLTTWKKRVRLDVTAPRMITIKVGLNNDEIIVRGSSSWMEEGRDDDFLEAIDQAIRSLASRKGWIVDSKTSLYQYRERIAKTS